MAPPGSQPRSIAVPILPHPTSTRPRRSALPSRMSCCPSLKPLPPDRSSPTRALGQAICRPRRQIGTPGRSARTQKCNINKILDLLGTRRRDAAQQNRVTEGGRIVLRGEIEMSQPQPFVGECKKFVDGAPAPFWHLHVESAGEVHRTNLLLPYEIKPLIPPAPGNLDDQLLFAGPVMRPIISNDDLFDEVDGIPRERGRFGDRNRGHRTLLERVDGAVPVSDCDRPDIPVP